MESRALSRPEKMLRPVRIRHYLSTMASMGMSSTLILEGTNIDASKLDDPDYLISSTQCETVIRNMIRLSEDSGIGFEVGHRTDLLGCGIMGYALITCRTMRETLDVWSQFSESLIGIMSKLGVETDAHGNVVLTIVEPAQSSPIFAFCVEEIFSMTGKTSVVECGTPVEFLRMELPYPAPAHAKRYEEFFDCPIKFDAENAKATIAKRSVELPLLANDEEFHRICLEHCGRILNKIQKGSPIATQVRRVFLASPQAIPSLEVVADKLNISSRTLRRRLQEEGHSYQSLTRDFRVDLAREYLLSTDMSAKEIGYLLGFIDVHSFRRAFRTWTGRTVREFRAAPEADEQDAEPQGSDGFTRPRMAGHVTN